MILDKLFGFIDRLSPGLRKVIANTTWLFADKILQLGMSLIVGLWVARYLKPEGFGLLNYAIATVGVVGLQVQVQNSLLVVNRLIVVQVHRQIPVPKRVRMM
jgi:hypothetical protein